MEPVQSSGGQPSQSLTSAPPRRLSSWNIIAYGFGHFYNDMCASMWFTYLLIFATRVLNLSSSKAGALILIGQVADAIFTPFIGYESDRRNAGLWCLRYGRRKTWHFVGFLCVTCSFAFLFVECLGCKFGKTPVLIQFLYYVPFVVVFQFGWAAVQISHLALIPDLSSCQHERATLNGVRYAFTVIANITVFGLVYIFLGLVDSNHKNITHDDGINFSYVAFIVTGVGFFATLFFYFGTKEPAFRYIRVIDRNVNEVHENPESTSTDDNANPRNHMIWRDWFKLFDFYIVAVLYMATRVFGNITQAYLPLYVLETQHFEKRYIALVPMVVYLSSFVTSTLLSFQLMSRYIPRKIFLLFGALLGIGASAWMWFHELHKMVYAVSFLLGTSSTILLVVSLSLIADLINKSTESSAFVYGAMSFVDKISTGVVIQIVQSLQPDCSSPMPCIKQDFYFRGVMVYVPGAALGLVLFTLVLLWPRNVGERQSDVSEASINGEDSDDIIQAPVTNRLC